MGKDPFIALGRAMTESDGTEGLCLGRVTSWPTAMQPQIPHKVLAGGNTQERGELLMDPALGPYGLAAGDTVLLLPIEEEQRYVILCKVVEV